MAIRALLVDDEEPSARYLQRLLEATGVDVLAVARDGREAIESIDRLRPELVFLDIELPELTGFDVLKQIRHRPLVVFVTAHGEYRAMAYETDAVAFLEKPVDTDRIREVLGKIQRMKGLLRGAEAGVLPESRL